MCARRVVCGQEHLKGGCSEEARLARGVAGVCIQGVHVLLSGALDQSARHLHTCDVGVRFVGGGCQDTSARALAWAVSNLKCRAQERHWPCMLTPV